MLLYGNNKLQGVGIMFYERFEELCRQRGLSPSGACLAMGRSRNLAAKWKSTGATPSMMVLKEIADFFGVSVAYLLGNEDEIPRVRQELLDSTELRVLFDAAKNVPAYKLYEVASQLMKWKEDNDIP